VLTVSFGRLTATYVWMFLSNALTTEQRVKQVPHSKVGSLVRVYTIYGSLCTGRPWGAVWQSSRVNLKRARSARVGWMLRLALDHDSPTERAFVRRYNHMKVVRARSRAYTTRMYGRRDSNSREEVHRCILLAAQRVNQVAHSKVGSWQVQMCTLYYYLSGRYARPGSWELCGNRRGYILCAHVTREWGGCYEDWTKTSERANLRGRVRGYNPIISRAYDIVNAPFCVVVSTAFSCKERFYPCLFPRLRSMVRVAMISLDILHTMYSYFVGVLWHY
jgi:hypothetical protein